jgi:hypothetical protein
MTISRAPLDTITETPHLYIKITDLIIFYCYSPLLRRVRVVLRESEQGRRREHERTHFTS